MKKISYEEDDANHTFLLTLYVWKPSIDSLKYAWVRSGYKCLKTLPIYCILT